MSRILRSLCTGVAGLAVVLPGGAAGAAPVSSVEPEVACEIGYSWQQLSRTKYTAAIEIRNTGTAVINGWTLRFTLPPPQQVVTTRDALFDTMSGEIVAHNVETNGLVEPANSVTVGYIALGQGATLKGFSVNGVTCT
jgi:hypothetical protein